jgi:2-dehydro-3-deoxyglucarate aldolase/4-hydroxy-2-oxoheptanedioate aldolase
MLPMISTVAQAEAIVAAMKYPPVGRRGVALGVAHDRYQPAPPSEALAAANERTVYIALIETATAIENIDAIAAVPGLDMLWVGHFDLSTSLGIPGQFDHADFTQSVERVIAAAKTNDLSLGRMTGSVDEGAALNAHGFDFICYGSDLSLLRDSLSQGIDALKAACA